MEGETNKFRSRRREIAEGHGNDASMGVESWKRTEARGVHGLSSREIRASYFDVISSGWREEMEIRYDSMVLRILESENDRIRDEETRDRST